MLGVYLCPVFRLATSQPSARGLPRPQTPLPARVCPSLRSNALPRVPCLASGFAAAAPQSWAAPQFRDVPQSRAAPRQHRGRSQQGQGKWQMTRRSRPRIPARPLGRSQGPRRGSAFGIGQPLGPLRRRPKGPGKVPGGKRDDSLLRVPGPSKELAPGPRLLQEDAILTGPAHKSTVFVHPKDGMQSSS